MQWPPLEKPPIMAECVSKDDSLAPAVHKTHSDSREKSVLWTEVRVWLAQWCAWAGDSSWRKEALHLNEFWLSFPDAHMACCSCRVCRLSQGNGLCSPLGQPWKWAEVLPEWTLLLVDPDLCPKPHLAGPQLLPFAHYPSPSWQLFAEISRFLSWRQIPFQHHMAKC